MTSPSLTRRRTTRRPSIRERRGHFGPAASSLAGLIALACAVPAAAGWRDLQRSEPPPPVVAEADAAANHAVVVEAPAEDAAICCSEVVPVAAEEPGEESGASASESSVEEKADCREALAKLRADTLSDIDLDIRVDGRPGNDYPVECRLEGETFEPRRFATTTFTWKAAGYCHKPLYFEHWNLERYGHSHGFVADSFLSAAHFFARIPALPYQMGVELPWECVYPLGYYRPGSCAPWTVPAVPVSARGFAVGAAAATGIVFLLP